MTELEICNSALIKCGAEKITQTQYDTPAVKRAILVATQYPFIRDSLLYEFQWKFAIKRATLTVDATPPLYQWLFRYELPTDCLRSLDLECSGQKFEIEDGYLLCDTDTSINLRYITKVTDTEKFDPGFCELLASVLAHDIAYNLVQSVSLKNEIGEKADMLLRKARSFHSQQGSPRQYTADAFINVRY